MTSSSAHAQSRLKGAEIESLVLMCFNVQIWLPENEYYYRKVSSHTQI